MRSLLETTAPVLGLFAGAAIGLGFGWIQNMAARRNQEQESKGRFKSAWRLMPGSGGRVALLLVTLVLIQVLFPAFFDGTTKWWICGGLVAGYGWTLWQKLRLKMAQSV